MKRYIIRFTAKVMLIVMTIQLVLPATSSFALTTGPSQPEVQSFEPVGTTEMVDLFSGDFVYNIPLLDIEGYPINIAYHSGINMEQEASWVGLGWNINPGEINRNVRGFPDDFNGEKVSKILNINDEKEWRFKTESTLGFELFGLAKVGAETSVGVALNNYKGMSGLFDFGVKAGLKFPYVTPQVGVGFALGSQEGATIEANAAIKLGTSRRIEESNGVLSLSGSTGFNTRSGLKNIGLNTSVRLESKGAAVNTDIPIGLQNYVPVITNKSEQAAFSFSVSVGAEIFGAYPSFGGTLSWSNVHYLPNGSKNAYGYLYAQNADEDAIMDFSREKDGMYNSTMPNLPLSSMTYDVYSISGQGGGGMCRPFRNDIGSVFDPKIESNTSNNSFSVEGGIGTAYELGGNLITYENTAESGPWFRRAFSQKGINNLFENVYFKQAGEMTYNMIQDNAILSSHDPLAVDASNHLRAKGWADMNAVPEPFGKSGNGNRSSSASLLSFITNSESGLTNNGSFSPIGNMPKIENYPVNSGLPGTYNTACSLIARPDATTTPDKAKGYHIGEMTQTLPDGRRYVYAIPAINNVQKEVTFSVANNTETADINGGLVKIGKYNNDVNKPDDSYRNGQGPEKYYQATYTPAYAHSYLLTSVLSPDYMDITGDGLSEDDLGSYTKINYSRTDADFRWIAPIQAAGSEFGGTDKAQFNPGFWTDLKDDKANYIMGSKEIWYMHSIESKNMIAEFYISPRNDGRGVKKSIVNAATSIDDNSIAEYPSVFTQPKPSASLSYKLDSIKLFSKHDRIMNGVNAVPIKTVFFQYDYSLCQNVPNRDVASTTTGNTGKLTLKRIYFRYGNSDKSLLNPYEFNYQGGNPDYNFVQKDRWGNYKPSSDPNITNYEFPYVKQDAAEAEINASAWHLTNIKLPSGGNLTINYEADDYSYVQDKRTMEMFKIAGVGNSSAFNPRDVLYENIDNQYQYIYFKRTISRELMGKTLRENYLDGEKTLYFSFDVDLANKNRYEHITGYAEIDDGSDAVGVCSGDTTYGYVKVKLEKGGVRGNQRINPATLASLNKGRYYLPQIMYKGYNDEGNSGPLAILKGMIAAVGELASFAQDANARFISQKYSRRFVPQKSWVRLLSPGYTKIGGGTRVKELKVSDGWASMTGSSGVNAEYGQKYFYKTLLDNNQIISSGVASYEPLIGADEIPQHRPANRYTADGGRLLPPIEFNQEEPFGESFYPGASVGYSKVTVASIHADKARSAKAVNVHEFYTAKDFPIQTDFTEKKVPVDRHEMTHSSRFDEVNVLQGYALIMNDMHGKPKAVSNYVIKENTGAVVPNYGYNEINAVPKELVTSTKYNYQTQDGRLYNKVKAVKRSSLTQPSYSVVDMVLGEETDFTIDNRMRDMDSRSMNISANLNAVGFGIFALTVPTVFFPDSRQRSIFKTMVATKIIQQYGILKSVETVDHGARVLSENVLYDSETGQPLLTTVNNEYNDPISNASLPAYWAYDNMGGAYFNTGYEEVLGTVYVSGNGKGYLMNPVNKRNYNVGDELLMRITDANNVAKNYRVWVTGMGKPVPTPLCGFLPDGISYNPYYTPYSDYGIANEPHCDGVKWWVLDASERWLYFDYATQSYIDGNGQKPADYPGLPPNYPAGYSSIINYIHGYYVVKTSTGWGQQSSNTYARFIFSVDNNGNNNSGWVADGMPAAPSVSTNCADYVPIIEPRAMFPTGSTSSPWIELSKEYKNVYVKVIRSGRRNQLNSMVQNVAIKGALAPASFLSTLTSSAVIENVLSASANTYTENASADEFKNVTSRGYNDYVLGKKGNFRDYQSYTFLADRNYDNGHNRVNGTYKLNSFWLLGSDNSLCSLNDVAILRNTSTVWNLLKTVTQYSAYGLPLEEVNASGIYSTALYGYNHALPVAVGSNISKNRLKYLNFEDLLLLNSYNDRLLGIYEMLPSSNGYYVKNYHNVNGTPYNYISYLPDNDVFGTGIVIDNTASHTGKYALKFTSAGKIKLANISEYETSGDNRYCYVSMWVKPPSGTISTTGMYLRGFGKADNANASTDFTAFSVKTNAIDGWYKLEGKIDMGLLAYFFELHLVMPSGYYIDDVRMYPDKGNMKSFAYDMTNMRLMAELDENNFATFYEYDQEGVLVRVKKESDRGILTVSENRKANAK